MRPSGADASVGSVVPVHWRGPPSSAAPGNRASVRVPWLVLEERLASPTDGDEDRAQQDQAQPGEDEWTRP